MNNAAVVRPDIRFVRRESRPETERNNGVLFFFSPSIFEFREEIRLDKGGFAKRICGANATRSRGTDISIITAYC